MRITVLGSQAIDRLVVGVDSGLWEDMTINTLIPGPVEEVSQDGEFRFEFGPLPAGQSLLIKIDAQINPDVLGGNEGAVTAYDGDRQLVDMPVRMEVLP